MCSLGEPDQQHVEIKKVFKRKKKSPSQINRDNSRAAARAKKKGSKGSSSPRSSSTNTSWPGPTTITITSQSCCNHQTRPPPQHHFARTTLPWTAVSGNHQNLMKPEQEDTAQCLSAREYSERSPRHRTPPSVSLPIQPSAGSTVRTSPVPPVFTHHRLGKNQEESFELLTKATAGRTFVRLRNFIKKKNSSFTPNPRPRK